MPRKKTVQPLPIKEFTLPDGTQVEIRNESCRIIGRGLYRRDAYEDWRDKVAEIVVPIYLDENGRKQIKPEDDFLISGHRFNEWLEKNTDLYPASGDDSSVKKRLYPDILDQITVLERSIQAIKGTS